jgi:mannosyltransferase
MIVAICLLAFGLRVFYLGTQSLWYDEGLSVHLASQPPQVTMIESAITDHPPLHALMLGVWMQMAGRSEFAVRFVSVWWSVLAVALTWRLGRDLLANAIGTVGALLMAASALAVWYAQEARGYSLLLALTLIATWAFVRLFCRSERGKEHLHLQVQMSRSRGIETLRRSAAQGDRWAWVALVASGVSALYTHYYAAFTLLALNLAFLAVLACKMQEARGKKQDVGRNTQHATRSTQYAIRFYLSQVIIAASFAPWLPAAIRQATTNVTYFPGRVGWQTVVGDTLRAFATGDVTPTTVAAWAVGVMGTLAIIGALAEQPGTRRLNRVIAVLLMAVPVAAMAVIAWNKPKFAPRYLIEALPAFYLLAGAGLMALWRFVGYTRRAIALVCASILLVTGVISLRATYSDPARQRPDMRGVAAYVTSNERPGDVIVLLSGHQSPAFGYYYRGANSVAPMPEGVMPPAQSPLDYRAARQLEDITRGRARLWLVLWQRELADPTDVVINDLMTKARRLGVGRDFAGMQLLLFDLQGHTPFGDGPQRATDLRFTEPITLAGYDLSTTACAPGESLDLALYWRASGAIIGNYQVFTHLLAPDGHLVAQSDHIAGADNYPTSLWSSGALIRNAFTLRVPADASPGTYSIEVGLYDSRGRPKLIDGTDRILLAQVVVK